MKKILLLSLFLFSFGLLVAQKEDADRLVTEGIKLHDKGDYNKALAEYDLALELDKDNLFALAEKALTLTAMSKYDDAIACCKTVIQKHPNDQNLNTVYVTYGNALDAQQKPQESLKIYDEGISKFPDFYQLYYNKGVTLIGLKEYNKAVTNLQKSVSLNPLHRGSENALARILLMQEKKIPSLLAFCTFLIIEPQGDRAKADLEYVNSLLKGNAEKTGKNSFTISIDPSILGDTTPDGKHKENSFANTEMILSFSATLDNNKKMKKNMSEIELFAFKFNALCNSLESEQSKSSGFYWDFYVPFFVAMKKKDMVETFAYLAHASSGDKKVDKWLTEHKKELNDFYDWTEAFEWKGK